MVPVHLVTLVTLAPPAIQAPWVQLALEVLKAHLDPLEPLDHRDLVGTEVQLEIPVHQDARVIRVILERQARSEDRESLETRVT